jgi:glutamine synthetase
MTVLNTVVAYQLKLFKKSVDKRIAAGEPVMKAILDETRETYVACKDICFNGDGYSDEWKKEAKRRGLDVESSVPILFDHFTVSKTLKIYKDTGVLSEVELRARNEVAWEHYSKKVEIESRALPDLAHNHRIPVAIRFQNILFDNVLKSRELFTDEEFKRYSPQEIRQIKDMACHINNIRTIADDMNNMCDKFAELEGREKAVAYHDKLTPCMDRMREYLDELEMIVDDQMWPLPKYRELLFIR